jgi:6-phosphogluconolactonase
MTRLLIGGYSGDKGDGKGIAVLEDDEIIANIEAESPSWIDWHPDMPVLYAVAETDDGGVRAWSLAEPGRARPLGSGATGGAEPCHLTVDPSGRYLVTVNYTGGSISVHHIGPDGAIGARSDFVQHEAHGDHPRQDAAHPHMVRVQGDELLVTDLGADAIYRYRLGDDGTLTRIGVVAAPPGSGPRHVLRIGGRYYVTAELSGQVLVFDDAGQFMAAVPASASKDENLPSELASDGRYLYVANRGPNTVTVFALENGLPRYVTEVAAGEWPRHIALDGDLLYVANERGHSVMAMHIDPETGIPALVRTTDVPSPTCVLL